MPLVRIDLSSPDAGHVGAVADAVHAGLVAALGIPDDDRFQVVTNHHRAQQPDATAPGGLRHSDRYLDINKDDLIVVAVTMRVGRPVEKKTALYAQIVQRLQQSAGVQPHNVLITLTENTVADWSFGNGQAQYL